MPSIATVDDTLDSLFDDPEMEGEQDEIMAQVLDEIGLDVAALVMSSGSPFLQPFHLLILLRLRLPSTDTSCTPSVLGAAASQVICFA